MKILILGRTELLFDTVVRLASNHRIAGIVTAAAAPEYAKTEKDFEALSRELDCPFFLKKQLDREVESYIRAERPDICISVNWVGVIGQNIISLMPLGILNAHLGDLPRYRGNAVVNWALLRREPEIVLTIHFMESGELDSGDILIQERMPLCNTTTVKDIVDFAAKHIPQLFHQAIDGLEKGTLSAIAQKDLPKKPFRCYPRLPVHSKIDWTRAAEDVDALVRASTRPYSGAYSYLKESGGLRKLYVWDSRVVSVHTDDLGIPGHIVANHPESGESWIYTGQGIIALKRVNYDGGPDFEPGKRWRSIRRGFVIDVEAELIQLQDRLDRLLEG